MFKLSTSLIALFASFVLSANPVRLSEPVVADSDSETFGQEINKSFTSVSLKTLLSKPDTYLDKPFTLSTQVAKVCQKKGCFFIAKEGPLSIRVAFKDYGFFIPSDSGNKQVLLNGVLLKKELSEKQAAHFNHDLGTENALLKAGKTYEIVASSVQIPKHG